MGDRPPITMLRPSITSSDSFAARAQRSEAHGVALWLLVLAGMLLVTVARRWAGGVVMTDDRVFYPYAGVLIAAIVCQVVLLSYLRRANRIGRLFPGGLWRA